MAGLLALLLLAAALAVPAHAFSDQLRGVGADGRTRCLRATGTGSGHGDCKLIDWTGEWRGEGREYCGGAALEGVAAAVRACAPRTLPHWPRL